MISNWQEVDLELFLEIFNRYWNSEGTTPDKVLEIQDLLSIYNKGGNRMFYGYKINVHDFPKWNEDALNAIRRFEKTAHRMGAKNMDECMISDAEILEEGGVFVSPLGAVSQHYDLNNFLYFGGEFSLTAPGIDFSDICNKISRLPRYYYREGENYRLPGKNEVNPHNAKVRIRTWDYLEWKKMTDEFIKNDCKFPEYIKQEDIPLEKILPAKKT